MNRKAKKLLLFWISIFFSPSISTWAGPPKGTVCTITLNSSDEKVVFKSELEKQGFNFVELVEDFAYSDKRFANWFKYSCDKIQKEGVDCDVLIISGHFAGTFFGSSGKVLSLEDLESASCNHTCDKVLKKPKAVYLFGCNTLAGKDDDHRFGANLSLAEQQRMYTQLLIQDGIERAQAEIIAEARYGVTGQSNKNRMEKIFSESPRVYGFNSIGPSGKNVKGMLKKAFSTLGDYKNYSSYLKKLKNERELKSADHSVNAFERLNNKQSDPFQKCLQVTSIACTNGLCANKDSTHVSEKICLLRNDATPQLDKLNILGDLLKEKDRLAYIPIAIEVLNKIDLSKANAAEKNAILAISKDNELKHLITNLIDKDGGTFAATKLDWILFAGKMGWLNEAETGKRCVEVVSGILNQKSGIDWDLIFRLSSRPGFKEQVQKSTLLQKQITDLLKHEDMESSIEQPKRTISSAAILFQDFELNTEKTGIGYLKTFTDPKNTQKERSNGAYIFILSNGNLTSELESSIGETLLDTNPAIRRYALEIFNEKAPKDQKNRDRVVSTLQDTDSEVKRAAMLVIREFDHPSDEAVTQIAKLLDDEKIGGTAIYCLKKIKPQDAKIKKKLVELGETVDW